MVKSEAHEKASDKAGNIVVPNNNSMFRHERIDWMILDIQELAIEDLEAVKQAREGPKKPSSAKWLSRLRRGASTSFDGFLSVMSPKVR